MVQVRVKDDVMARALCARLAQAFSVEMLNGSWQEDSGTAVVTTTLDTTPADCLRMARHGFGIIVLAPAIRKQEREEYIRAGALAYLEMSPDATELIETIRSLGREDVYKSPLVPIAS